MSGTFPGFSPQALAFFEELATNNRKEWFEVCNRTPDSHLFSAQLLDELQSGYRQLAPLYRLLWQLR